MGWSCDHVAHGGHDAVITWRMEDMMLSAELSWMHDSWDRMASETSEELHHRGSRGKPTAPELPPPPPFTLLMPGPTAPACPAPSLPAPLTASPTLDPLAPEPPACAACT
eukprot:CAMPEP_0202924862 /NCGR_PEP_ID=MMETSP1392-20130828/79199_1 /ASSEMBLY_ACC=CAM_ASM_000868 /TAXON_ID=225041 /ORGANISM="Chlamydomonas chlamydogama, Strain SAG 11-48b" /LENGTH=109 /DNA_ID=CAMNT_0049618619 /DNA_START=773 /DNA_END=1098 /DNA_ORIENTATION=+